VNSVAPTGRRQGESRSESDTAFVDRYNTRMRLPVVASAIVPLVVVPQSGKWPSVPVGIATWLVFVLDYIVHTRHLEKYATTAFGRFG
jgi:voltage-gated potassium channel